MKAVFAITAAGLLLASCATVRETYAPDGRKAYSLNCSGTARGWDKCYSAAGEQCGAKGYDIISRIGEVAGGSTVVANQGSVVGSSTITGERAMVIACKP